MSIIETSTTNFASQTFVFRSESSLTEICLRAKLLNSLQEVVSAARVFLSVKMP